MTASLLPTHDTTARSEHSASRMPAAAAVAVGFGYLALVLKSDSQYSLAILIGVTLLALGLAARFGVFNAVARSFYAHERFCSFLVLVTTLVLAIFFRSSSFVLFLMVTILVNMMACLALNIQLGYAGLLNFAGASMMGIGAYTAALIGQHMPVLSPLLLLPLGGFSAALIGSVLLLPMLRTAGHYSAVVTIAFGLLFTTFLDSFQFLGGSQGLAVSSMQIYNWDFSEPLRFGSFEFAFYANYLIIALILTAAAFVLLQRIERSWIGLKLDAVRSDEIASSCFGISIVGAKFFAFTMGNFVMGVAGALYAFALGYIAPSNFSFADSLILISIILLGGIGSNWGIVATTIIVLVLPERLQAIQEYRLFIYAVVVLLVLLFVPKGLIPRPNRRYFSEQDAS